MDDLGLANRLWVGRQLLSLFIRLLGWIVRPAGRVVKRVKTSVYSRVRRIVAQMVQSKNDSGEKTLILDPGDRKSPTKAKGKRQKAKTNFIHRGRMITDRKEKKKSVRSAFMRVNPW